MVEPLSTACLAAIMQVGNAISLQSLASGIAGNRADSLFCKLVRATSDQFIREAKLPENHDILRAIVGALQQSLVYVSDTLSSQSSDAREGTIASKVANWVRQDIALESSWLTPVTDLVAPLIGNGTENDAAPRYQAAMQVAVDQLIEWIEQGIGEPLSERFKALFVKTAPNGRPAWPSVFQLLIREAVKTNSRFERIFVASNVADIAGHVVTTSSLIVGLSEGLETIEAQLCDLTGQIGEIRHAQIEQNSAMQAQADMMAEMLQILRTSGTLQKAENEGISEAAVRGIIARAGGEGIAREDLVGWLEAWVDEAKLALAQSASADAAFEKARIEAHARFRRGDLLHASRPLMDLLAREKAESDQRKERLIRAAVEIDLMAFALDAAIAKVEHLAEPHELDARNPSLGANFYHRQGNHYYVEGNTAKANGRLLLAIRLYEYAAMHADRAQDLQSRVAALTALANAQLVLGPKENTNTRLSAAVENYDAALALLDRDVDTVRWAAVQTNLGCALTSLAFRQGSKQTYSRAEDAFRQALELTKCAPDQQEHNRALNGLASLNVTRGLRTGDADMLRWSIANYEALLGSQGQGSADLSNALATAYRDLGSVTNDRGNFERALLHAQRAREERNRKIHPVMWALDCALVGSINQLLHAHPEDKPYLLVAREAHKQAMTELERTDHPIEWARCVHNVAACNKGIAKCYGQTELFAISVEGFDLALEERTREIVPLEWARTKYARSEALIDWDEREGTTNRSEAAFDGLLLAMEEIRPDNLPLEWRKVWGLFQVVSAKLSPNFLAVSAPRTAALLRQFLLQLDERHEESLRVELQSLLVPIWGSQLIGADSENESEKRSILQSVEELEKMAMGIAEYHKGAVSSPAWAYSRMLTGLAATVSGAQHENEASFVAATVALEDALAVADPAPPANGSFDVWGCAAIYLVLARLGMVELSSNKDTIAVAWAALELLETHRPEQGSAFAAAFRDSLSS